MDTADRDLAREFFERGVNQRDIDFLRRVVRDDFVDHGPPSSGPGLEAFLAFSKMALDAFPDLQITVEDVVAEGDRVVVRVTVRGTHHGGPFLGLEPTGRQATWTGIDIFRFEDGQIAERWSERNVMSLMTQLSGG